MDAAVLERVDGVFRDFHAYFSPLLGRRESQEHSSHYVRALLVQSQDRRNAENLSESVGSSARSMQRFLTEAPWDDDAVMGRLQEYLAARLEHPLAVWVVDGSDFPKQGMKSAGVARQYCGVLGKIAPPVADQAGMFLAQVSPLGRALVDKRLYLPESWTGDDARCQAAGAPQERREYRSKTELALEMVERALERGHLKARWVAGDDAFGVSPSFREGLSALGMRYVLDVPASFTVWPEALEWASPADQGRGRPMKPQAAKRAAADHAGAGRCRAGSSLAGDHGVPGEPGPKGLPVQRPAGAAHRQAPARRDPLGSLSPEPRRRRAPLLPLQRPGGHTPGNPGLRGWLQMAHRNRVRDREERPGAGRV